MSNHTLNFEIWKPGSQWCDLNPGRGFDEMLAHALDDLDAKIYAARAQFADAEVPSATADPAVFTLARSPNPPRSLLLFVNGIKVEAGADFTLSGATITFLSSVVDASIEANYRY